MPEILSNKDVREIRINALALACNLNERTIKLRLDKEQDDPLAETVLADARLFEAYLRGEATE